MKNSILLMLAVVFVACSTPSGPAPVALDATAPSVSTSTAVAPPHTVLDEPEQPIAPPPKVDTRTPAQKLADAKAAAMAACRGTDGIWHCNDPSNKNSKSRRRSWRPATPPRRSAGRRVRWATGTSIRPMGRAARVTRTAAHQQRARARHRAACHVHADREPRRLDNPAVPVRTVRHGQPLSSQPPGTDPIFFEPRISGGGYARLLGTPILVADIPVAVPGRREDTRSPWHTFASRCDARGNDRRDACSGPSLAELLRVHRLDGFARCDDATAVDHRNTDKHRHSSSNDRGRHVDDRRPPSRHTRCHCPT